MKKFRSQWFRVAVEGATSDKRTIKRSWLEQAARNFDPNTYGARVWLEHYRSTLPDGPFKAYGDVLAVKTDEIELNGQTKLALFAQIEPTRELIALNKARQKIYTSIEIDDSFADTGEAYIVGLAVTDSPASLGTDVLAFSAQKPDSSPFKDRHYSTTSMFTEALETHMAFEEYEEQPSLIERVKTLLKRRHGQDEKEFSAIGEAVEAIADHGRQLAEQLAAEQLANKTLRTELDLLCGDFKALKTQLSKTLDPNHKTRPLADGGGTTTQTHF